MSGIVVCGLNGSGKSTFAKALAKQLSWEFVDIEDCFFPKEGQDQRYSAPRSREEAAAVLLRRIRAAEHFVLAAVKADYGQEVEQQLTMAVWLRADPQTRAQRVRQRSYDKFGSRMLPGGDLHQEEEEFFRFCAGRSENEVEAWLSTLSSPTIPLDCTLPIQENVELLVPKLTN